jgi:hypothetical protein
MMVHPLSKTQQVNMEENELDFSAERALSPETEGTINFQGREIRTATMKNGQGFVSLRSLCDAFGVNYRAQQRRVARTDLFKAHSAYLQLSTAGGQQAALCLYAYAVPAFLMGFETERLANEEAREVITAFQEEGMAVLAEHFGLSERGEIEFLRESLARMVVQQDRFEAQTKDNVQAVNTAVNAERQAREEKVQQIREAFSQMREDIRTMKQVVGPQKRITPEQVGALREMVMVLGQLMIVAGESNRPWPAIYSDITLQFGFSKVEDITQEVYPRVEKFLDQQVQAFRERILQKPSTE